MRDADGVADVAGTGADTFGILNVGLGTVLETGLARESIYTGSGVALLLGFGAGLGTGVGADLEI